MSSERRFNEKEIAAIFKQAAEDYESQKSAKGDGLSLAELKQIGEDAGIPADYIARAAAAVMGNATADPPVRSLGFPISVSHTIALPRPLTDEEWEHLVVDLRRTFKATGQIESDGSLRHWRNGNLKVLVEPAASGHRLHFQTMNGNAVAGLHSGLWFSLIFFAMAAFVALRQGPAAAVFIIALLSFLSFGISGLTALRLPGWRTTRKQQMKEIAGRTLKRLEAAPTLEKTHQEQRLDLDALPDAEESHATRTKNKTSS